MQNMIFLAGNWKCNQKLHLAHVPPLDCNPLELNTDIFQKLSQERVFFALKMRILGYTSHNLNFWNQRKTFSQFSVVLDQCSRGKEKEKPPTKTMLSLVIEPFQKHRPAGREEDNSAKHGRTAAVCECFDEIVSLSWRHVFVLLWETLWFKSKENMNQSVQMFEERLSVAITHQQEVHQPFHEVEARANRHNRRLLKYNAKVWKFQLFLW